MSFIRSDMEYLKSMGLNPRFDAVELEKHEADGNHPYVLEMRSLHQKHLARLIDKSIHTINENVFNNEIYVKDVISGVFGGIVDQMKAYYSGEQSSKNQQKSYDFSAMVAPFLQSARKSFETTSQQRKIEYFNLEQVGGNHMNSRSVIIVVQGFMTEGSHPLNIWPSLSAQSISSSYYTLQWQAGNIQQWNKLLIFITQMRSINSSTNAAEIAAEFLIESINNPWHAAQYKASQVGKILGEILLSGPSIAHKRKVDLIGHSLGAALIYNSIIHIALSSKPKNHNVHNVVFLAGAFILVEEEIKKILAALPPTGKIINVYNPNDYVLSTLFRTASLTQHYPVGSSKINLPPDSASRIINLDISNLIPCTIDTAFGHSYASYMPNIIDLIVSYLK